MENVLFRNAITDIFEDQYILPRNMNLTQAHSHFNLSV